MQHGPFLLECPGSRSWSSVVVVVVVPMPVVVEVAVAYSMERC
jgi:hypothetical protein